MAVTDSLQVALEVVFLEAIQNLTSRQKRRVKFESCEPDHLIECKIPRVEDMRNDAACGRSSTNPRFTHPSFTHVS